MTDDDLQERIDEARSRPLTATERAVQREQASFYVQGVTEALRGSEGSFVFVEEDRPLPGTRAHELIEALLSLGRKRVVRSLGVAVPNDDR